MSRTFERFCEAAGTLSPPAGRNRAAAEWLDSQSRIIGFWLDELIAEGDDDELISTLHRHEAWLNMVRQKLDPAESSRGVRLAR